MENNTFAKTGMSYAAATNSPPSSPPTPPPTPPPIPPRALSPSPLPSPPPTPPPNSVFSPIGTTSTRSTTEDQKLKQVTPWAHKGRLAWLDIGAIGPHSVIRQRLTSQERVAGFEGHPVLIWEAPDENGIAEVIPITSFGGQRAEVKWGRMRPGKRYYKLQQLLLLEQGREQAHHGTEVLYYTEPLSCRKRGYLNIEHGSFKIEVESLVPYTHGPKRDITLSGMALLYIQRQLLEFVHPRLWDHEGVFYPELREDHGRAA